MGKLNADGLVREALPFIPSSISPAIAANLQNNHPTSGSQNLVDIEEENFLPFLPFLSLKLKDKNL